MKRIILSTCDRTYTQLGNLEALVSLLKGAGYDVNYTSEVSEQEWVNYPLIITFKDEEYVRVKEMNLQNNLKKIWAHIRENLGISRRSLHLFV